MKIQPLFTDEDEIITLDFFDIIAYRVTDEQFYMTGLDNVEVGIGVFYKVEKSEYNMEIIIQEWINRQNINE